MLRFSLRDCLGLCPLLVAGCTAVTGAGKFEVDDAAFRRDFDYKFVAMSAHASPAKMPGVPMELALVDEQKVAQSRARVYFPLSPASGDYPDVEIVLQNALWPGPYKMYFYVDNNENYLLDTVDAARSQVLEHTWVEDVAASGKGSFEHSTNFEDFDTAMVRSIGDDVLIRTPAAANASLALLTCLSEAFSAQFTDSVEIRVFFIEEDGTERQMGLFKTYPGVVLPREIKLEGIVDRGSNYKVEIVRDAVTTVLDKPAVTGDIVLEPEDWANVPASSVLGCRN